MQLHPRESGSLFWQTAATRLTGFDPQAGHSFLGQLDWMLRCLSTSHIRISLVRLVLPAHLHGAEQAAAEIAQDLDDAYGMAGVMWDGSIVAAFFGPRQAGPAGDRQQTRTILRRLRKALRDAGVERSALGASVSLLHRWTDEISDVSTLMLESVSTPRTEIAPLERTAA